MEKLSQALDSLQDDLLTLYEKDSDDLHDQITHWKLNRKEQVLFYYCRRQGVTRLGVTPIPPLAVSQQKAKAAIEQQLLLESLLQSEFGKESWTLTETSRERLLTEPKYCFKKHGTQIEVRFDHQADNTTRYTLWGTLYYQNSSDVWVKTQGKVDRRGLFYTDENNVRVEYVNFEEEAKKYGKTGVFEVLSKLTPPAVPTSSFAAPGHGDTPPGSATRRRTSPEKTTATPKRRKRPRISSPRFPHRRGLRGGGEGELAATNSSPRLLYPTPEEVGKSTTTPSRGHRTRLGRLLLEAADPPILVLKGGANSLKCLRFRLKQHYSSFFLGASTTWYWTSATGNEQLGRSRMLLSFTDEKQRDLFMKTVKLPRSVQWFKGSLEDM